MTQATIKITGIGPVEITTELAEVVLVGALTISGDPVNCKTKKVSCNPKAAKLAKQVEGTRLKEIKPGHFMLIEDNDGHESQMVFYWCRHIPSCASAGCFIYRENADGAVYFNTRCTRRIT